MLSKIGRVMNETAPMRWLARIKRRDSETGRYLTEARRTLEHHREVMAKARETPLRLVPANGHRRRSTD